VPTISTLGLDDITGLRLPTLLRSFLAGDEIVEQFERWP
jgi:hypothetical protein